MVEEQRRQMELAQRWEAAQKARIDVRTDVKYRQCELPQSSLREDRTELLQE